MTFNFSKEKNEILFRTRSVSFYQAIEIISEKGVLLDIDHPNKDKYPNQKMFVIDINGYSYCIPYIITEDEYFLKTIFPSRKFMHLIQGDRNGQ